MSYKLLKAIESLQEKEYNLNYNSNDNTLQTRSGLAKIICNPGTGRARCFPFSKNKKIELFQDNEGLPDDLLHEKTHLDMFPYDFISYGVLYLSTLGSSITAMALSGYSMSSIALVSLVETFTFGIGYNLYLDILVGLVGIVNKRRRRTRQ